MLPITSPYRLTVVCFIGIFIQNIFGLPIILLIKGFYILVFLVWELAVMCGDDLADGTYYPSEDDY